jgi:hypothetical protein
VWTNSPHPPPAYFGLDYDVCHDSYSDCMTTVMMTQTSKTSSRRTTQTTILRPGMPDTEDLVSAAVALQRGRPHKGPLRVLVGKEQFSENHAWADMPQQWPSRVAGRFVIEVVGQGQLEARLVHGGPPVDVVVPLWSPQGR